MVIGSRLSIAFLLAAALAARWAAVGADDRHRPVLLVAHGPTDEAEVGP